MITSIIDILSDLFFLIGIYFIVSGTIGCLKFPNFFTRLHAASVVECTGTPFIIFGIILKYGFSILAFKLLLLLFFIVVSSSTAAHALALAAISGGSKTSEVNDNA